MSGLLRTLPLSTDNEIISREERRRRREERREVESAHRERPDPDQFPQTQVGSSRSAAVGRSEPTFGFPYGTQFPSPPIDDLEGYVTADESDSDFEDNVTISHTHTHHSNRTHCNQSCCSRMDDGLLDENQIRRAKKDVSFLPLLDDKRYSLTDARNDKVIRSRIETWILKR